MRRWPVLLLSDGAVLASVDAFGELFQHGAVEGRNIIRVATGDQALIGDRFLIDPVGAGIFQIGP